MENSYIHVETQVPVAVVEFGHPKGNSFTRKMLTELKNALDELSQQKDIQFIVLQSAGKEVFCAGANFDELKSISNQKDATHFFKGFAEVILAMVHSPKFIIGNIQGKTVGGGVGIIAACDYALALENATIRLSELSIGIGPFVIEPVISEKIGVKNFSRLALFPTEWKSANWCKKNNLYDEVFAKPKTLEREIQFLINHLSSYSTDALAELKKISRKSTNTWEELLTSRAEISARLLLTDFTQHILHPNIV